jgi:hypothetical protein
MSTTITENEARRIQRISLPLPSRVEVKIDQNVAWNEVTRLTDVSAFGAGFSLKRPVKRGRLVHMTIPMPRQLRCYDHSENQYRIWGLVRRCLPVNVAGETNYVIGVAFIGASPPPGYFEKPSTLYDITHRGGQGLWLVSAASLGADAMDAAADDGRRQTRFFIPESVNLEILDDDGSIEGSETTVTENLSLGGAAVFTSLNVAAGSFVRLTSERTGIKIISIVRAKRLGPDGLTRLHLEFIDRFFPLEGLE